MNAVLVYFGVVGIIVGGLGLAFQAAVPGKIANVDVTSSVHAAPVTRVNDAATDRSAWTSEARNGSVPFSDPTFRLGRPVAPAPAPSVATAKPAEVDVTVGIVAREPEWTPPQRKARPKPKPQMPGQEHVRVEVRDQHGRRIRTGQVPRERSERQRRDNAYGGFFGSNRW